MKKIIPIFLFSFISLFAQAEYVEVVHPIYSFLERMETQQIISDYNSFELPKTRKEIGNFLAEINQGISGLDKTDKEILNDFLIEFEYEIFDTNNNSISILGEGIYDLFSQNEKYLYYLADKNAAIFINLLGEGELLRNIDNDKSYTAFLGKAGGDIRGTFLNKFSFRIIGTNGKVFGDKIAAFAKPELKYNYKLNETPDETFFDNTIGYAAADFDYVKLKLGRNRLNLGYGNPSILNNNAPRFDYISLNLNYKIFSFSYFHGKLLGSVSIDNDTISGAVSNVEEKYIAYHRLGFNLSKHADFGIGEIVIYGDRPIDLTYLNPFNFYKSIEHSNQDRDNSMIFIDFNNNSIKSLKIFMTLLIDDISFDKIGKGWYGNKTFFSAGFYSNILYGILPMDFTFQYNRVEPYTFTHRLLRNNFTNSGYSLSSAIHPNTELFFTQINFRFNHRLKFAASFEYSRHGANPVLPNGEIKNIGGNINLGHRTFDAETIEFMGGDLEYSRIINAALIYEPVNQYYLSLQIGLINESLQNSLRNKEIISSFLLSIRF